MNDTPPCCVCKSNKDVIVYPPDTPGETICPDCCQTHEHPDGETGHKFYYERAERGHFCLYCGVQQEYE